MKDFFTIITFLVISMSSANAQVVWGVRAGASMPSLETSLTDRVVGNFGFEVGPIVYLGLKNNWYLNLEAMFNHISFDVDVYVNELMYKGLKTVDLNMDFLEIPLYVGRAIPLGKVQTYAQVGPYFGFKLSESDSDYYSESKISDFNAGIGAMYGIDLNKFKIEIGYQRGILNVNDNDNSSAYYRLNSLFLGVSYVF